MGVYGHMICFSFKVKNKISKFFVTYEFYFDYEKSMLCALWHDADARKPGKLTTASKLALYVIHWNGPMIKLSFQS